MLRCSQLINWHWVNINPTEKSRLYNTLDATIFHIDPSTDDNCNSAIAVYNRRG